jgi:hypothetical protein
MVMTLKSQQRTIKSFGSLSMAIAVMLSLPWPSVGEASLLQGSLLVTMFYMSKEKSLVVKPISLHYYHYQPSSHYYHNQLV